MAGMRERILALDDTQTEKVPIPEWDETVEARGLTGEQRGDLLQNAAEGNTVSLKEQYWKCILLGIFDPETGEPVFAPTDRDGVLAKSGKVVERLAAVVLRLSGMAKDEVGKEPGESTESPTGDSPTN